jgi:hypothetical protein
VGIVTTDPGSFVTILCRYVSDQLGADPEHRIRYNVLHLFLHVYCAAVERKLAGYSDVPGSITNDAHNRIDHISHIGTETMVAVVKK